MLRGLVAARLVSAIALAAGTRLVTEVVAPGTYGVYKLAVGAAIFAHDLTVSPLTQYAMRRVHDAQAENLLAQFVGAARRSISMVSIAGACFCVLFAVGTAEILSSAAVVLIAGAVGLHLVLQAHLSLESGFVVTLGDPAREARAKATTDLLTPVSVAAAAVMFGDRPYPLIAAQALVLGLVAVVLRRQHAGLAESKVVDWLAKARHFALPLVPVAALGWLFAVGDRYLLAWLTDTGTVGRYAAVYGLVAAPLGIVGGIIPSMAYEPSYRKASEEDLDGMRRIFHLTLLYQLLLVGGTALFLIAVAPIAVSLLLADAFQEGVLPLVPWIALGQGAQVVTFALDIRLFARERTSVLTVCSLLAVTVNIVANLLLIPLNGALGAAQATGIAGLIYFATMYYFARSN